MSESSANSPPISSKGLSYLEPTEFIKPIFKCWSNPYSKSNPEGYINLGVAESVLNEDLLVEKITEIRKKIPVDPNTFGYGDFGGSPGVKKAFARFFERHMVKVEGVTLDPNNFLIYAGTNTVLETIGNVICNPDEYLLLDSPYYHALDMDFARRFDVLLENVPLQLIDGAYHVDFGKTRERLTQNKKIRGILLVNPHNPTGKLYTDGEIQGLMDLCLEFNVHLISDEVYGQSVLDSNKEFKSVYHYVCSEQDSERAKRLEGLVHVIYSASKDWGLNGWRFAVLFSRNKQIVGSMASVADMNLLSRDTMLVMEHFFGDEEFVQRFITTNQQRLREFADKLMQLLDKNSDIVEYVKPDAGMFVYFRSKKRDLDQIKLFDQFMDEGHVMLAQGRFFKDPITHWYRCCFTCMESWSELELAMERVLKALRTL